MKSIIFIFILSVSITGSFIHCGSEKSESFSYDYSVNGCKTGKHSFDSKEAYCNALKSRSQNNDCAYLARQSDYANNCQGVFVEEY